MTIDISAGQILTGLIRRRLIGTAKILWSANHRAGQLKVRVDDHERRIEVVEVHAA